jgi:maltooligosyltrehalose trehalohydrolase
LLGEDRSAGVSPSSWRFGPTVTPAGVTFRVWAPAQSSVSVVIEGVGDRPLTRDDDNFFSAHIAEARPGHRYWLRLAQGLRPDPASRFQPDGPLGASLIVDDAFHWTDEEWPGVGATNRQVIYELHLGTFTAEGTWLSAVSHLARLAEIGITTVEVMPIAEFPGRFGWGYDGVHWFAPTRLYGTPEDVRTFVDAAHRAGIAVILDVVYNHLGPVGNFLTEFSPTFFGPAGEWGDLLNFDGPGSAEVRRFVVENARYWIESFHFDGLRLDATQTLLDTSPSHIVADICKAARSAARNRSVFLVGESEPQDTTLLRASGAFDDGLDAIWNEDWHHAAAVCATGRRQAYYSDYLGTAREFAAMARLNTLYQGQWYAWQQQPRGGWAMDLPSSAFVCFLENHDQVANSGLGDRLHRMTDGATWRTLTALLLLGPAIPLLFQGQEFGSTRPFAYFADHEGELAGAVRDGRFRFLSQFSSLAQPAMRELLPIPHDPRVFERAKLDESERAADTPLLRLHRDLISLRREDEVLQALGTPAVRVESAALDERLLVVRYLTEGGHRLLLINFGDDHRSPMNEPLLAPAPGTDWVLAWSSDDPRYGGTAGIPSFELGSWLIPGATATLLTSRRREALA